MEPLITLLRADLVLSARDLQHANSTHGIETELVINFDSTTSGSIQPEIELRIFAK